MALPDGNHDDAGHPRLPAAVTAEMSRLFSAGHSLLPLGGPDSKAPTVAFRDRKRLPLSLVMDRMAASGSETYGIRLEGILVVDVDTDTPEARAYVDRRFGSSPARTVTSRGYHLYFRHQGPKPVAVRLPGIAIDFKAGNNEFVVGPQSRRTDGICYVPEGQVVARELLPIFQDHDAISPGAIAPVSATSGRYQQGTRHDALKRRAHQLAQTAESFEEMFADLVGFRDWEIESPEDFPDGKIESLASWYWDKRERGELWGGQDSVVQLRRHAIFKLAKQGEALAFLLYGVLLATHGHQPDGLFAIVPDGFREKGLLRAGRRQIYAAIDVLLGTGLLVCRKKPRGKRNHYLYQLADGREKKREGSKLILVSDKDTHSPTSPDGLAA
ncbi:hypothetical protein ASD50_01310 [Mesorhizobium sp. Root552]|uniref:bifunctional DNA primase/polymerase n=1 Tax=Mesorhizobium sp. Root552 TaxID=1736555 RepID=UPI0006F20D6B|nr:bifunctional DNA primase/polymerase [Mesorhizobium sp. Root552]KQZ33443.1 hypothetical protein ASD50_01310 [Mesorhizobium sp. Root552]